MVINRAVEEGQTVAAGFETPTLFTIAADLTKMQVIADVDEADIGNVEEGQRVSFTVDAYPNDQFEGVVRQIRLGDSESTSSASSSTSSSTVVTYEVVITADNPDLKLKPRLTANVTIYTLERGASFYPRARHHGIVGYDRDGSECGGTTRKTLGLVPPRKYLEPEADYGRNQQQQRDRSNRGLERGR